MGKGIGFSFFSSEETHWRDRVPFSPLIEGHARHIRSRYRSFLSRPRCIRNFFPYPFLFSFFLSLPPRKEHAAWRFDAIRTAALNIYIYIYLIPSREKGRICQTRRLGRENLIFPAHAPRLFLIVERGRASRRHFLAREAERKRERERKLRGRIRKVRRRERRQIYGAMQGGEREGKGDRVRHRIGPGEYVGDFPPFPWTSP